MLKMFVKFYQQNQVEYLVKTDEDSFINLPGLSRILLNEKQTLAHTTNVSDYFILGKFVFKLKKNLVKFYSYNFRTQSYQPKIKIFS
jgi:hypothetical protein